MKHINNVFFALIFFSSFSQNSEKSQNVLFIGNSFTYFYDMPKTVQEMVDCGKHNFKIYQSTYPGMSLDNHLNEIIMSRTNNGISTRPKNIDEKTETEKMIAERAWDLVILQTGTVQVLIPEARDYKYDKAVAQIKQMVNNPNCKFVIFNTWPKAANIDYFGDIEIETANQLKSIADK